MNYEWKSPVGRAILQSMLSAATSPEGHVWPYSYDAVGVACCKIVAKFVCVHEWNFYQNQNLSSEYWSSRFTKIERTVYIAKV